MTSASTATSKPTTAPATTALAPVADVASALRSAIVAYERQHGVARNVYQLSAVTVSPVDATWARFTVGPAPGYESTFEGGYGVAHRIGAAWSVVDFGTAEVGCSAGGPPPPVRASLNLACPG